MCKWMVTAALGAAALGFYAPHVSAAPGMLDTSFGVAGVVRTNVGTFDVPSALAVQPDHRLVAAGTIDPSGGQRNVFVVRYLESGGLDPGFGTGGMVVPNRYHQVAPRLVIQPLDGKIVLATRSEVSPGPVFVYRFGPDGTPDAAFGSAGTATLTPPAGVYIQNVAGAALAADGKLVVCVRASASPVGECIGIARFNADGSPDLTFGTGGFVRVVQSWSMLALAFALQPDGRMLVTGFASLPGRYFTDAFVARLRSDGSLDTGFNVTGIAIVQAQNSGTEFQVVRPSADGSVLVGGRDWGTTYGETSWLLARFTSAGALDPSFGTAGVVRYDPGAGNDVVLDLAETGSGIAVTGQVSSGTLGLPVAMFDEAGHLDTSFGAAGFAGVAGQSTSGAVRLALQPDGKIVAIGSLQTFVPTFEQDLELARYLGDVVTATELALGSQEVRPDRVTLTWYGAGTAQQVTIERATAEGEWVNVGTVLADGMGRATFEDGAIVAGQRYGYRAAWWIGSTLRHTAATWVEVPRWNLAFAPVYPNPAREGRATVSFTLPEDASARLEILDVAGRSVRRLDVAGAGSHELPLGGGIGAGLYWLRLRQGSREVVRTLVVVH
jgi:uncharacterized delta-60 repeat protein